MPPPLAIVTGASSGIGRELAVLCADNGFDLLIAADAPAIHAVAAEFSATGVGVDAVEADLATIGGVDRLYDAINGRPVKALLANAGHGLGHAFLDQNFDEVRHVIDTNITGTIYLIQRVAREMRARQRAGFSSLDRSPDSSRARSALSITARRHSSTRSHLRCARN